MTDIDKLARELANIYLHDVTDRRGWRQEWNQFDESVQREIEDTFFNYAKTALASYANDYCDSLLFVLADIRQKTGVGDKPMLGELADAIVANKLAYGDECAKKMRDDAVKILTPEWEYEATDSYGCGYQDAFSTAASEIRALPLPSEKVKP